MGDSAARPTGGHVRQEPHGHQGRVRAELVPRVRGGAEARLHPVHCHGGGLALVGGQGEHHRLEGEGAVQPGVVEGGRIEAERGVDGAATGGGNAGGGRAHPSGTTSSGQLRVQKALPRGVGPQHRVHHEGRTPGPPVERGPENPRESDG